MLPTLRVKAFTVSPSSLEIGKARDIDSASLNSSGVLYYNSNTGSFQVGAPSGEDGDYVSSSLVINTEAPLRGGQALTGSFTLSMDEAGPIQAGWVPGLGGVNVYNAATVAQVNAVGANFTIHTSNFANPHNVTKSQVGLSEVDNTSDEDKPVSIAQQSALNLKANIASPTFTGNVTVPYLSLQTTGSSTFQTGRIRWNDNLQCIEYDGESGTTIEVGQELTVRARNVSGSTIPNGAAVYVSGATGTRPQISLATAASILQADQMIGLVTTHAGIANNSDGYVTVLGLVRDLDTSAYDEGDELFLSSVTPGSYSVARPVNESHGVTRVGYVLRAHGTQGVILVSPHFAGSVIGDLISRAANAASVRSTIGLNNVSNVDTSNASNITAGTLNAARLADSGAVAGTYGSSTQAVTVAVDSKGRVTSASHQTVTPDWSTITNRPTSVATSGLTDAETVTGSQTKVDSHNSDVSAHGQTVAGRNLLVAANVDAQRVLLNIDETDNTSDEDKPVSIAQQQLIDNRTLVQAVLLSSAGSLHANALYVSTGRVIHGQPEYAQDPKVSARRMFLNENGLYVVTDAIDNVLYRQTEPGLPWETDYEIINGLSPLPTVRRGVASDILNTGVALWYYLSNSGTGLVRFSSAAASDGNLNDRFLVWSPNSDDVNQGFAGWVNSQSFRNSIGVNWSALEGTEVSTLTGRLTSLTFDDSDGPELSFYSDIALIEGISGSNTFDLSPGALSLGSATEGIVLSAGSLFVVGVGSVQWPNALGRILTDSRQVNSGTGLTGGGDLTTNRTLALTGQALALHNLGTNGIVSRTSAGTVAARTITGTTNQITLTNGDGVSGNPTISLTNNTVLPGNPSTAGTFTANILSCSTVQAAGEAQAASIRVGMANSQILPSANLNVNATLPTVTGTLLTTDGNGSLLTNLNASNLSSGTLNVARLPVEAVQTSRTISTTAPLTGGGDLSANRTLAVSTATDSTSGIVPGLGGASEGNAATIAQISSASGERFGILLPAPGTVFSVSSGINLGTGNFSIRWRGFVNAANANLCNVFRTHSTGNNRFFVNITAGSIVQVGFVTSGGSSLVYPLGTISSGSIDLVISCQRNGNATMYVNGRSVSSASISGASGVDVGSGNSADSDYTSFYTGTVSSFEVLNTTVNDTEVAQLHLAGWAAVPSKYTNLTRQYAFDGSVYQTRDRSVNKSHLRLTAGTLLQRVAQDSVSGSAVTTGFLLADQILWDSDYQLSEIWVKGAIGTTFSVGSSAGSPEDVVLSTALTTSNWVKILDPNVTSTRKLYITTSAAIQVKAVVEAFDT